MKMKQFISALVCAAMSLSLFPSAIRADEHQAGIGDISSDNSAYDSEAVSSDLTGSTVDMEHKEDDAGESVTDISETATDVSDTADTAAAEPTATPEPPGLPSSTRLINGGFEYPVIQQSWMNNSAFNIRKTGNGRWFLNEYGKLAELAMTYDNEEFGWRSTARRDQNDYPDGMIEIVVPIMGGNKEYSKQYRTTYGKEVEADSGRQFAELVARDQSTLYQNLRTFDGESLSWQLSHRARQDNYTNYDTMALFIGPAYDGTSYNDMVYNKPKKTNGLFLDTSKDQPNYDMFMWMAELIYDYTCDKETKKNNLFPINADQRNEKTEANRHYRTHDDPLTDYITPGQYSIYADPRADSYIKADKVRRKTATKADGSIYNYKDLFSMTRTDNCTDEWKCWIMTDGIDWARYQGTYEVPEGQLATTFAFTALSGDNNLIEGNNLDAIQFTTRFPLDVRTTTGGSGMVYADNHDDVSVTYSSSHHDTYIDGTEVTITAQAEDENHSFIGMYIDGIFRPASEYTPENGVYTQTVTMDKARDVHLVFAERYAVRYDPNGGTFRGDSHPTTIYMTSDGHTVNGQPSYPRLGSVDTEAAVPADPSNTRFIGWYFAHTGTTGDHLINAGHTIDYTSAAPDSGDVDKFTVNFSLASDTVDDPKTVNVPAADGLTFIAQYEYLQKAIGVIKSTTDLYYYIPDTLPDGCSVSTQITSVDGANRGEDYGRMTDKVRMTARAGTHYTFMGWYTEPNGGEKLSSINVYTYSVTGPKTVYARFSANLQYPYLSFISENELTAEDKTRLSGTNFALGSHIKAGDNDEVKITDLGTGGTGTNDFGNTISTGFIANTEKSSGFTVEYCKWVVSIPINKTIYIKTGDKSEYEGTGITLDDEPLFTDSENIPFNRGSIYKVKSLDKNADLIEEDETLGTHLRFEFVDRLPVKISGNTTISYGLVIDNIYAPGAQATIVYDLDAPAETESLNISTDETHTVMHSSNIEDYVTASGYPSPH